VSEPIRPPRNDGASGTVHTVLRVGGNGPARHGLEVRDRMRSVQVRAAMKSVPTGIPSSASLEEAEERMDSDGVNWLPVIDRGRLVGLITRLDIRQAASPAR
jgi:CBS domain-containing protein